MEAQRRKESIEYIDRILETFLWLDPYAWLGHCVNFFLEKDPVGLAWNKRFQYVFYVFFWPFGTVFSCAPKKYHFALAQLPIHGETGSWIFAFLCEL
jgi:hypothetical protein